MEDIQIQSNGEIFVVSVSQDDAAKARVDPQFAAALFNQAKELILMNNTAINEIQDNENQLEATETAETEVVGPTEEDDDQSDRWFDQPVKLLLATYGKLNLRLGSSKRLSNKNKMWEEITLELTKAGYTFNVKQVTNKFRTLERRYKKTIEHNNKTGRDRITCPYEKELDLILAKNPATNPVALLEKSGPTIKPKLVDQGPSTSLAIDDQGNASEEDDGDGNPATSPDALRSPPPKKKKIQNPVAHQLQLLREDRKEELELKKLKLEAYNRRTAVLDRKNDILESMARQK